MATREKVLIALQAFDLREEGPNSYRCNRPWSPGSDSQGLTLTFEDGEHGAYFDHVAGQGGSLYQLAQKLKVQIEHEFKAQETKKTFAGLDEYAQAHGATAETFKAAGWKEVNFQNRPALEFPTKTGKRWRFLDGQYPLWKSVKGYKKCWYGLERAVNRAKDSNQPLIICNGEPSVIVAQARGLPACAVTSGENADIPEELFDELRQAWQGSIILAPDCDDTGYKWARKWLDRLNGYQAKAVDFHGSKGFDLADFILLNGEDVDVRFAELPDLILKEKPEEPANKYRWTVDELLKTDFPEMRWIVQDRLPAGLTVFAGRPKLGKSILANQIAVAVATGGMVFDVRVEPGPVLFLALEDSPRRVKDRLVKMGIRPGAPIVFYNRWKPFHKGGIEDLLTEMMITNYRLVVVDTWKRATAGLDSMKNEAELSTIFDQLQRFSINKNMGLLIIDHTRKKITGMSDDPVDDVLGSSSKTTDADAILALYRQQGVKGAKLMGRLREGEEFEIQIVFDPTTFCWQLENKSNFQLTENRVKVLDALRRLGSATLTMITAAIPGANDSNIRKTLNDLINAGLVKMEEINGSKYYSVI